MPSCTEKKWYVLLLTNVIIIFSGFFLLLLWKLIMLIYRKLSRKSTSRNERQGTYKSGEFSEEIGPVRVAEENQKMQIIRVWTSKFISGQNTTGKIIVFIACVCTFITVGDYIYEATNFPMQIERCGIYYEDAFLLAIDIFCYSFFTCYYVIRFLAAENKIEFWFGLYSLVDLLTIPSFFMEIYLDHLWMGLRFLRAIWLMQVPDLLQYLGVLKSATKFRLGQLSTMFICMWIVGSGMTHMLENTGDTWLSMEEKNKNFLTFGDSMYFTIVTMSTVGYGDISPHSFLGKIWVAIFILVSFAIFASFIPEIAEILFSGSKYTGSYVPKEEYKHIVVCGNFEFSSIQSFMADFFNEDRPISKINVVFINQEEPDFELRNLLKMNFMRSKFIKGTVMDQADLKRASIEEADACFILANHNCKNPKDEDAANIMRVISLKNFSSNVRVLIQLLQYENKSYLTNIPTWNKDKGDTVVCYSEMELRILAKSCLIPGYSTFISNLFSIRSESECKEFRKTGNSWINDYINGMGLELYTSNLSLSLIGMSFYDLVLFSYEYLNLLLIAVEVKISNGKTVFINPASQSYTTKETVGYFICNSFKEAQRVALYCNICHGANEDTPMRVDKYKCLCINKTASLNEKIRQASFRLSRQQFQYAVLDKAEKEIDFIKSDFRDFKESLIKNPLEPIKFSNHIILCIFADNDSPSIGLKNFIIPLRSKKLNKSDLRPIIIASNEEFLHREWRSLASFPNIYPISFNNINKKSLSVLQVENCHVCVIMSARVSKRNAANLDFHLVDKEIILGTLNVKSIFKKKHQTKLGGKSGETPNRFLITKLLVENNVQFLDQEDEDEPNCPVFLSEIFACGSAFTTKMLDCLLSIAYFNPDVNKLISHLIAGEIHCFENVNNGSTDMTNNNVKCQIRIFNLYDDRFQSCFASSNCCLYKNLFAYAFKHYHLLLMGLYKVIETTQKTLSSNNKKVILTNPDGDFSVSCYDSVLGLQPLSERDFNITD